jgi:ABC-type glycerol-3-phosphate transport system permease component
LLLLSTHFLPPAVSLIAYVIVFQALDLMDTCTAQVVVGVAAQLGYFCVLLAVNLWPFDSSFEQWLMTQGATAMKAMMHSLWARARQPIARVALLLSLIQWNEYFYALALSGGGKSQTLPVVVSGFITGQDVKWGPMFAGSAMVIVPALLIAWAVERSLLRGFSLGAVR